MYTDVIIWVQTKFSHLHTMNFKISMGTSQYLETLAQTTVHEPNYIAKTHFLNFKVQPEL